MADTNSTLPIGSYETNPSCPYGTAVEVGGKRWVYVKFLDAVAYTTGMVVGPASATAQSVSNDVAGGSQLYLRFAGAIPNVDASGNTVTAVPTQNQSGWVQTDGYHSAIRTNGDDDIAQGDTLIMVATDGVVDSIAKATTTGTLLRVGYAADADVDAANTVAAWLTRGVF